MRLFKHGGMYFWKIGRLGGTFYVKRRATRRATREIGANDAPMAAGERNALRALCYPETETRQ